MQNTIKIIILVMLVAVAASCAPSATPTPVPPTVDIEAAVQLTVAAQAQEATIQAISVQQTEIAAAPAAVDPNAPAAVDPKVVAPVDPNAPDAAAPGTTAVQVVADPNQAVGTPQLRVNLNSNCRKGDSTAHSVVTVVSKDSVVPVVAKNTNANNGVWYKVQLPNNVVCWMSAKVATPVDATLMDAIPADANIPPPPATATATATSTRAATATATATTTGPTHTPTATTTGPTHTPTATTNSPTHTPTPTTPSSSPATITIYNNTGVDICYVFTGPISEQYGDNQLFSSVLLNGETENFSHPDEGPYDVYAEECIGGSGLYWEDFNNFGDLYWELN